MHLGLRGDSLQQLLKAMPVWVVLVVACTLGLEQYQKLVDCDAESISRRCLTCCRNVMLLNCCSGCSTV